MKKTLLFILAIPFFLASCSNPQRHIITLWTNRPEIAAYVEEFNASGNEVKVEIEYKRNPGRELARTQKPVDILFDEYLNSYRTVGLFSSLDGLLEDNKVDRTLFYRDFLSKGIYEEHQVLLPVSFNLPVIYFKKESSGEFIVPFFMNIDNLKKAASSFNAKSSKSFKREGFSPLWNKESAFQIAVLKGTDFRQLGSVLSWNDDSLNKSVDFMREWIETVNGGLTAEKEFEEKFLYDPMPRLIDQGRTGYGYDDINSFFSLPPEKRENLDFRWLSSDNKVYVLNSLLYTGIPKTARNKKDARIFLTWFFRKETQKKLLEASLHKRIRIFGIGQGFSAIKSVNADEMPRLYPALMGHIPPESSLVFPDPVPGNWKTVKDQIIVPWIFEKINSENPPPLSLKDAVVKWEKQNPAQNKLLH